MELHVHRLYRLGLLVQVFAVFIGVCRGYVPFQLTDCTAAGVDRVVTISGGLTEHPVTIPGHVSAPGTVTIHKPVTGDLRLDVTVEKYIVWDYYMLPCVSKVGSCSYDVCELLEWFRDRGCPSQLQASGIPCMCPFQPATHTMGTQSYYVPGGSGVWSWIAFGDFRVNGRLVNTTSGLEVNCYTVEFSVQQPQFTWEWDYWGWY